MARIPRPGERRESGAFFVATDDAAQLAHDVGPLLEQAEGVGWYDSVAGDIDLAALLLCRLRRAGAGVGGAMEQGDAAVRAALAGASPEALVWFTSRAISYMDETGYPESVERLFPEALPDRQEPVHE